MGLGSKILTRIEPTIELDKLKFKSYGEKEGENPGDSNTSKDMGVEHPLITINKYRFKKDDIKSFEIALEGVVPSIELTILDSRSQFTGDSFPRDGDVISVRLAARAKDTYKDIRIDFDITSIDSPPRDNVSIGNGGGKYSFSGTMKIPGLYAEQCKSYGVGTTLEHFEQRPTDLKIGLASNVDITDDSMNVITTYEPIVDTIDNLVKHSYVSDDAFQTYCIDPYYYINYIDLNVLLNADEGFEEMLASMDVDFNDVLHPDASEGTNNMKSSLILTSHEKLKGTNLFITKYALKNNTGENVKSHGYKRVLQFFENESEEGLVSFDVEPLTSTTLGELFEPLKGRRGEERYKQEIKYKYVGRRHSDTDTLNTHVNYNFAEIHNKQNLQELDKMYLEVELSTWNPAIYRYQKIPIAIYNTTMNHIGIDTEIKTRKEKLGFEAKNKSDFNNELSDKSSVDEFLSGFYIVGSIRYTYKQSDGFIKQQMTLLRREWPSRLNNLEG